MNADNINPFLQGSQSILHSVCGERPVLGDLFLKKHPYACMRVSIELGILGDIKGNVVYTMEEDAACGIASKMMFGMPVPILDEMSQSAISELGNMISGTVATLFSENGRRIDITPPIIHLSAGEGDFSFGHEPEKKIICVPLKFQDGKIFEVDILF